MRKWVKREKHIEKGGGSQNVRLEVAYVQPSYKTEVIPQ